MKRIFSSQDSVTAYQVQSVLEAEGVPSIVQGDNRTGLGVVIGFADAWTEVWVEDEYVQAAEEKVKGFIEKSEAESLDTWQCPKCGEDVEGQFGACWSCGTDRT